MIMEPSESTIEVLEEQLIIARLELDDVVKSGIIPQNIREMIVRIERLEQAIISKQLE